MVLLKFLFTHTKLNTIKRYFVAGSNDPINDSEISRLILSLYFQLVYCCDSVIYYCVLITYGVDFKRFLFYFILRFLKVLCRNCSFDFGVGFLIKYSMNSLDTLSDLFVAYLSLMFYEWMGEW